MSCNTIPTIPFILPLYYRTQNHLTAIFEDPKTSFTLQTAVSAGLTKLKKYFAIAQEHHMYTITASTSSFHLIGPSLIPFDSPTSSSP